MKIPDTITDNITDILVKIISFTKSRHDILLKNINHVNDPDFLPKDMAVDEFSGLMNNAINEHILNRRLLLCDTETIKFGTEGHFSVNPQVDNFAHDLLIDNRDKYLELQVNKMMENSLNMKLAVQLLKQKEALNSMIE